MGASEARKPREDRRDKNTATADSLGRGTTWQKHWKGRAAAEKPVRSPLGPL